MYLDLKVDARSPIPIRRQLTEQLKHAIEGGGVPRDQALPSIRELAGFLGINPNTVARVVEDLKRGGYVESRRGKGVFVVPLPPARPSPHLRDRLLQDVVIRAAALGMTADDVAVGVLSVVATPPVAVREAADVLLVECCPAELDFFARELESRLPVRVSKVLLGELATVVRRQQEGGRWRVAVTSFSHLPAVKRLLRGRDVPVIALPAGARLETLHELAGRSPGTRVGVVSAAAGAPHDLARSVENAGLPNIALAGVCSAEGPALDRLVRRADVIICSTSAGERVRALAGSRVQVILDDRALDQRGIEMLADLLVRQDGVRVAAAPPAAPTRRSLRRPGGGRQRRRGATRATVRAQ